MGRTVTQTITLFFTTLLLVSALILNTYCFKRKNTFRGQVFSDEFRRLEKQDSTFHYIRKFNSIEGVILIERQDLYVFNLMKGNKSAKNVMSLLKQNSYCSFQNQINGKLYKGTFKVGIKEFNYNLKRSERVMYNALHGNMHLKRRILNAFLPILISCEFNQDLASDLKRRTFSNGFLEFPFVQNRILEKKLIEVQFQYAIGKDMNEVDSAWVCGRGLYGNVSEASIRKQVIFNEFSGFKNTIFYDIGLTNLRPNIFQTGSVIVNLKPMLQRLYGINYTEILLRTVAVGQLFLRFDCMTRAKAAGINYILFTDLDEYLYPGLNFPHKLQKNWLKTYLKSKISQEWMSVGTIENSISDKLICSATVKDILRTTNSLECMHFEKEIPDLQKFVISNWTKQKSVTKECSDVHYCTGATGHRKYFIKTSLSPLSIKIHEVAGSYTATHKGMDESILEVYLRHHSCLN